MIDETILSITQARNVSDIAKSFHIHAYHTLTLSDNDPQWVRARRQISLLEKRPNLHAPFDVCIKHAEHAASSAQPVRLGQIK